MPELIEVDPNKLIRNPDNIRSKIAGIKEMAASIKAVGIIQPPTVTTQNGSYLVIAGERRVAGAIQAGLTKIQCILIDVPTDSDAIAKMLVENTQRESLTLTDQANAVEQLALVMNDAEIAKALGVSKPQVAKARAVAAAPKVAKEAERYHLSLDDAAILAEFSDQPEYLSDLIETARFQPDQFRHEASRYRQNLADAQQEAIYRAELEDANVTILASWPDMTKAADVDLIKRIKSGPVYTAETHAACPGHAALFSGWKPEPKFFCLDWNANDHWHTRRSEQRTPADKAEAIPVEHSTEPDKSAERKRVIANNKAWRAAEPVRRQFVKELLQRRTTPKEVAPFVTEELLRNSSTLSYIKWDVTSEITGWPDGGYFSTPLNHAAGKVLGSTPAQLWMTLLGYVASAYESVMGVHTWRAAHLNSARYFAFLDSVGYTLSDIELEVVTMAVAEMEKQAKRGKPLSTPDSGYVRGSDDEDAVPDEEDLDEEQ